ncbi:unnamed protein product [Didymodactylos carnosus]|uniref:Uncharacterized protein n=1 Tax=Didymodactylos carnosus TaxID=1234261 RepID=A0A8S2D2Q8_9BILA|nr:unnamed protein product [Didymodactylos carnosus]CAF3607897.1 unnamed protein product [Didymodactylos carnosus]
MLNDSYSHNTNLSRISENDNILSSNSDSEQSNSSDLDVIPFHYTEYEKIPITAEDIYISPSSSSSSDKQFLLVNNVDDNTQLPIRRFSTDSLDLTQKLTNRKRRSSSSLLLLNSKSPLERPSFSIRLIRKAKRRSRNPLTKSMSSSDSPSLTATTGENPLSGGIHSLYYSLTSIDNSNKSSRSSSCHSNGAANRKKTSSKLDVGYASDDDGQLSLKHEEMIKTRTCSSTLVNCQPSTIMNVNQPNSYSLLNARKAFSDYSIRSKIILYSPLPTMSLPVFNEQQLTSWRHSITSAYDTCSNTGDLSATEEIQQQQKQPILDTKQEKNVTLPLLLDDTKAQSPPSLLIYDKKYTCLDETKNLKPTITIKTNIHKNNHTSRFRKRFFRSTKTSRFIPHRIVTSTAGKVDGAETSSTTSPEQDSPEHKVQQPKTAMKHRCISHSYDASAEYTDPEKSENDVDSEYGGGIHSDQNHRYQHHQTIIIVNSNNQLREQNFYNRYTTTNNTTTTTTTGYSSDIEQTTTGGLISDDASIINAKVSTFHSSISNDKLVEEMIIDHKVIENRANSNIDTSVSEAVQHDQVLKLKTRDSCENSDVGEMMNAIEKSSATTEGSEPCWDNYQNPLYRLDCLDHDSIESTLRWEDQFFEMDDCSQDHDYLLDNNLPRSKIQLPTQKLYKCLSALKKENNLPFQ